MRYALLLLLFGVNFIHAQDNFGLNYDASGAPLMGYIDQLIYKPNEKVAIVYNSDSFEPGYYYSKDGKRHTGKIKFDKNKIWFINNGKGESVKLKTDIVSSFVVGIDSFCLIRNFFYENELITKNEFAQFISDFDDIVVFKHLDLSRDWTGSITGLKTRYLVKRRDETNWKDLSDKKSFKKIATEYFGSNTVINSMIISEEFDTENIHSMVKTSEYQYKAVNNIPVYYNSYWQEVSDSSKASYYGSLKHEHDSVWSISYYKNDTILYKINYSRFIPNNRNGIAEAYYCSGNVRTRTTFRNDSLMRVEEYSPDQKITLSYKYIYSVEKIEDELSWYIQYDLLTDSTGELPEFHNRKRLQITDDTTQQIKYYQVLENGVVKESYRLLEVDTVYQIIEPNKDIRIEKLQKRVDGYLSERNDFDEASALNAQGVVLVKFLIDRKGRIEYFQQLNSLTPDVDEWITDFIKYNLKGKDTPPFKFRPYKKVKTKYYYEVVIPFEFSISRLYRKPWNYYNHHWHWHNHMFMQQMHQQQMQQMHQQHINNMQRSMPSYF